MVGFLRNNFKYNEKDTNASARIIIMKQMVLTNVLPLHFSGYIHETESCEIKLLFKIL